MHLSTSHERASIGGATHHMQSAVFHFPFYITLSCLIVKVLRYNMKGETQIS